MTVLRWVSAWIAPKRARRLAVAGAAAAALGAPSLAGATTVLDLPRILLLADHNHPNVAVARSKVLQARAQLDEAHYAPFSQFSMTGGVALAPQLYGNNVFSPNTDVSLSSSLGVAWQANITGVLPIWTFGKITNLWDAAEANVKLNQATLEKDRDAVRADVRKAFFGLQLAREGLTLLTDVHEQLDDAKKRLQTSIGKDEGDPVDLAKLEAYSAEVEVRESEASRFVNVALAGLRFYTGVPDLDVPPGGLQPPRHKLGHVTRYLTAASLYRPELAMARAGLAARRAQLQLARSNLFPDLGVGVEVGVSAAPEIADQLNPFVTDPGNYFHYGVALVFQWKLDFLPGAARVRFAEAQLDEVRSQQKFALGGVGAEVEVAYAEVQDWQRRREIFERAVKASKRWFILVKQGIDLGTREDKEIIDAAKSYATNRYNLLNATMELDLAMSKLALATGWDAIAPDGT